MDYKYDDGIELLLAHMNIEDIINAAESLYQIREEEAEEGGLSFEEEGLSQEERRIEEEEKKVREEQERIAKQIREANEDTILK